MAILIDCLDCNLQNPDRTTDDFKVYIFDSNNNKVNASAAAGYFYSSFMGCEYPKSAPVLTREFYNSTQTFLSERLSGEDLVNAKSALYTYLKIDQTPIISVNDFATRYLRTNELCDDFEVYMKEKGVSLNGIPKNLDMLKLRSRKIKFSNKVSISAPSEDFNKNVEIIETSEEATSLRIMGAIVSDV